MFACWKNISVSLCVLCCVYVCVCMCVCVRVCVWCVRVYVIFDNDVYIHSPLDWYRVSTTQLFSAGNFSSLLRHHHHTSYVNFPNFGPTRNRLYDALSIIHPKFLWDQKRLLSSNNDNKKAAQRFVHVCVCVLVWCDFYSFFEFSS